MKAFNGSYNIQIPDKIYKVGEEVSQNNRTYQVTLVLPTKVVVKEVLGMRGLVSYNLDSV